MKRFGFALVLSVLYLIAGNFVGVYGMWHPSDNICNSAIVEMLFAPYAFIAGMSAYAGWDWLSYALETVVFAFTIPCFYALLCAAAYLRQKTRKRS